MSKNFGAISAELKKYIYYIPGAQKASAPVKWGVTALLGCLCIFLLIPVSKRPDAMLQKFLAYSPAKTAQEYYDKSGPKAAYDFINFYESLPGAVKSGQLKAIREKAEAERASWMYMGKEVGLGFLGLEHHEKYAGWAKAAVSMVPYGKDMQNATKYANEIIQEWKKYSSGKELDMLHLGVATLGLLEVGIGLAPVDNPMIKKLKAQTNVLLDSLKLMNSRLRDVVSNVLEPAFKSLEKTDLVKEQDANGLLGLIKDKSQQFLGILNQAETGLNNFQGLVNLENKHKTLVPVVVASSSDLKELDKNSALAEEIAKLNPDVLLYGGPAALEAAEKLKARGKFDIKTLEAAMLYGTPGLEAVGEMPLKTLEKEISRARNGTGSEFRVPGILVFIIVLASLLVLLRTWMPVNKLQ